MNHFFIPHIPTLTLLFLYPLLPEKPSANFPPAFTQPKDCVFGLGTGNGSFKRLVYKSS